MLLPPPIIFGSGYHTNTRSFRHLQGTTTGCMVSPKSTTTSNSGATTTKATTEAATIGDQGDRVRQGLGVRQMRSHVPDQEVLGAALGA